MDKPVYTSIAINLVVILFVLIAKNFLPPVVPLFYGKAVGEQQLIASLGLTIPPLVSLLITAINFSINRWFIKDLFLKNALLIASVFTSILSAITVLRIIFLVGLF